MLWSAVWISCLSSETDAGISEITFHLELQLQGVALALFLQNIICKKCVLINIECHSNIKTRVGQNICIHTQECISIYMHIYNAI